MIKNIMPYVLGVGTVVALFILYSFENNPQKKEAF